MNDAVWAEAAWSSVINTWAYSDKVNLVSEFSMRCEIDSNDLQLLFSQRSGSVGRLDIQSFVGALTGR